MTSSGNSHSIEPWSFRSAFADSWLYEALARDAETLTKGLQRPFSNNDDNVYETPTVSNLSGSDPETFPKRHRTTVPGPNARKITKRKPRASKKTQTTFIAADPANFRHMVQEVTGVRFGNRQVQMVPVLKPEPQRLVGGRLPGIGGGNTSTLDPSVFLLDHRQHVGSVSGYGIGSGQFDLQAALVSDGASTGLEFDALSNFPTLESWKVI